MPATVWRKSSFSDQAGSDCVEVAWRKSSFSDGGGSSCVEVAWRKSTFSDGGGSDCVEVGVTSTGVAVRDSKNPDGGVLRLPVGAWAGLVAECSCAIDS
jgi:hypothetical protein